jgi:hypothetical protein
LRKGAVMILATTTVESVDRFLGKPEAALLVGSYGA